MVACQCVLIRTRTEWRMITGAYTARDRKRAEMHKKTFESEAGMSFAINKSHFREAGMSFRISKCLGE